MTTSRRLTALPLPLLRTTRRLTSSRFSPSGKSLPSSPLVLTTPRRLAPKLLLLLIGLAVLLALLPISSSVQAQTPANQPATGRPVVLASAQGAGILFADTEAIDDGNGLPITIVSSYATFTWSYQWIRVDGMTETNVGADSATYQPVEADVGKLIKVEVSFTDGDAYSETVTSLPFGPITAPASTLSPSTLVSNTGQSPATTASITQRYAMGFRLGDHGQGYEISSVSIDLAAVPSSLTVSLWSGGVQGGLQPDNANKLFDFANPSSFAAGLNEFTAPAGAFAYPNVNYFVVLSGFGSTLSINETTSDNEDAGGETGAVIYDDAAVRALSETGFWAISDDRAGVLRMAVEGSRRTSGILASTYAQPVRPSPDQEIISLGDDIGFGIQLGAADRYLIRGVSLNMDDSTPSGSGFTNPYDLRAGSRTGTKQFSLVNSRKAPGLPVWTAPQGSTVTGATGGRKYVFDQPVGPDSGDENTRRRDAVLSRAGGAASRDVDRPAAAGVTFTGGKGDVDLVNQLMALLGEPLYAMVQNLGQTGNSYASATATNAVLSQGFTTGPNATGYRLQGIGVNIEGSGSNFPDGPTSVSVAVHADSGGKPGSKLFDLLSPTEYAAGHSFFEAPPGTTLEASTSYVLVWSHLGGTEHRLHRTLSDNEDAGALAGFSIANVFYRGADVDNLNANSTSNVLEIAVYTNRDLSPPKRVTGFDLHGDNLVPRGIWGNEETIWVANDGTGGGNKIFAYKRSDGLRDSSSDFNNLNGAGNTDVRGICSDGTTMFVADSDDDKVYAYKMSDTTRDSGKDVTLDSNNDEPKGLSCDPTHLWVAQDNDDLTSKIFVYLRSDESHVSTLDIGASTLSPSSTVGAINNNDQRGMWSNGTTLFVVDDGDDQVYGYQLSDRSRDDDKNLSLDAANASPWGLWFDGRVLWVVDNVDDRVYVYDLPGAQPDNTRADGGPGVRTPSEQVWATTLTAGTNPALGFGYITLLAPSVGSLSTTTFTRDSDTYTIKDLYDGNLGALVFILDKEMPVPFTLSVAGQDFRSISSVNVASGTGHIYSWNGANLTWSASDMISVVLRVGVPPTDGVELTAGTARITDTDGLDHVYYHYQWIRIDGTTVTELDGETGPTYTATADDVTKDIQVRVIFDDDVRNREYPRYSPQVTVREVPPVVTGVTLTSMPGSDDTYAIEDSVTATVTFDKAVDVTAGPQITLLVGTADKAADCAAATNTTTMECSYEVEANDTAPDGVGIKANTLALNGGTIYSTGSTTNAATLTHLALGLQSGHLVDGIRPTLVTTGSDAPRSSTDGTEVILTFSENIWAVDPSKITVKEDGTTIMTTSEASTPDEVVKLTLGTTLLSTSGAITVELDADAVEDLPGNGNIAQSAVTVLVNLQATPLAPTNLSATPAPDTTPQLAVDLSWTAPTSDGGSAITSHQYRYFRTDLTLIAESFGSWITIDDSAAGEANATSFTVTGLSAVNNAGTTFTFEVRAINDNGNGTDSSQESADIHVPDPAPSLTWVPGNGQVELTWVTPDNNGSAILRYRYSVFNDDTNSFVNQDTNMPNSDADTTSFTVTGLTNGVSYQVGIQAVNSVGPGTYKTETGVVPATHPTAPRNLRAQAGDTQITLRWTAPISNGGVDISGYEYRQKTGTAPYGSWTDISGADDTTTEHTVTGLTNGTTYRFKVRAKNPIGGEGPESNEVTAVPRTVPTAPQSLSATAGNGSVRLDWTAPSSDGGLPINRYQYRYKAGSGSFTGWANVPGSNINTTSYTVTGLTNGTLHTLEVRAATASTVGVAASATATPMAVAPGKPSVTVQSRDEALYVSWTLEDDGGSNITEYQVQWRSGSQSFDSTRQQAGLTATNTRIENLINGTEYDVRVRAMNSINWGPWSDIDSGTPVEGPAVSLSAETLTIDEGGFGSYSVVITTEPTAPVSILISPEGDVTTQPNALVFTASNWNIWQKVTVNAAQDGDADDDAVTIHHYTVTGTSAPEYASLTGLPSVQVTVLDDDVPPPAVRGFIAVDESQDAIALSWWSERGAGEYELEYRKQGDTGAWTPVTRGDFDHLPSTTGNRSLTGIATGLECETTYDFRIRLRGSGDILLNAFGPHTEVSRTTGECAQPNKPTNLMYTLDPDCATLTWTAPTGGDYTGVRIRRLTLGDPSFTVIHEDLNSRPTSYRDCTHTGDGYGDGDSPEYAYAITYIKRETRSFDNNAESKVHRSGLKQYGPAVQDHLHATPRNVRLTLDTDSQRRMTWEAPPSGSLTIERGLQGASVPVSDPWITGYVVERREFRARADGYLYFPEPEDTPIWSATMTVGSSTTGTASTGYFGLGSNTFGAMTQTTFTHSVSSGSWEVTGLFVRPTGQSAGLKLSIQETPPTDALLTSAFADWVLVVDGRSFPFELDEGLVGGGVQVSWPNHGLSWANGQRVSVQLVERELFEWERLRRGRDGDTSTSFTDNEQANGRKFVYRIMTANTLGVSTNRAIFDWLFDSPYRDAVVDLAATDTSTDDGGGGGGGGGETDTGNTGGESSNTPATGAPAITGTPQVGQTLSADTSPIDDEDGLTNVSYGYQWSAGGSDIAGATGSTHTLTAGEQGQTVQVRVTFTDDADNEETLTSEATVAVAAATAPAPLTAGFQDLPDSHDGSTAFTFRVLFSEDVGVSYVNMRDDAFSLSEGDVTGARRVDGRNDLWEITVEPDDNSDVGITLPANRSCTTTGAICTREDSPRQLTNSPTATVTGPAEAPPTNTSAAGAPTISGTPQVEQTLTADTSSITDEDGLTNVSYSYQWMAGGSDIAGATGSTYTLTSSEQGKTIQVRVTFTDDADNEETLTSVATVEVTAAPVPLTASRPDSRFQSARHNGADDRPQVIVAFSLPVASFEKTTPSLSLTGAAVSSVRQHEEDGLENAWIFFLYPEGSDDIVFSLVTGQACGSGGICTEGGTTLSGGVQVILPGPEEEEQEETGDDQQTPQNPPAKPTNLTATVNADGHIVLSWKAPDDDSITGYQVLRRRPGEGESALLVYVADTESTVTTFTDTGVTAGVKHVYRVKAINAAGLSDWSNYVNSTP